jgi:hypothetical protein
VAVKAGAALQLESAVAAGAAQTKKMESEHTAVVADMQKKLATVQEKCERLVSGGMTFSPDTADTGKRTAGDVDPRNRLHPALR